MKQKSYKYAWCDLSPSVGNEACGIRFCEILKVLENELIVVLPYFFNGKSYIKMEQHQRTISIHRIKEKTNKIPKTHLIKKPPQNYDNVLKEFLEIERMFLKNE